MYSLSSKMTERLTELANEAGFDEVGFAKAQRLDREADKLEEWLQRGYHGKMSYMENHFEKRVDPTQLVPGAKSVVTLTYNYYTGRKQDPDAPKISKYAYGKDYHFVIKRKLKGILAQMQQDFGEISGRVFVDSAPVLERDWAARSGIGWTGKNTLLLHPKRGSFFFLAEMILDAEFEYGSPMKDYCGTCTRCIDACPTDAIQPDGYILDARRCISYLTIELREQIPEEFSGEMEDWMFGCDICQDVCPWNRFSEEHAEEAFVPAEALMEMDREDWEKLTEEQFRELFRGSAVKRTKYAGLKRNIEFISR